MKRIDNGKILRRWLPIAFSILFLIVGWGTLKDYGISWDEPAHFIRGQAYVDFFLTGTTCYESWEWRRVRSYYEVPSACAEFYFQHDSGHPPLNGILAALSNRVLYQWWGVMGDIESYQVFNLLVSGLLVFVVVSFAVEAYGSLAGVVAGVALMSYPLFFGESHFNIKDPAETAFYAATIWAFWKALKEFSWKWMLLAGVSLGFGLSVKFNIIFLPLTILPWLLVRYVKEWKRPLDFLKSLPKGFVVAIVAAPFLVAAIFWGSWPYLWRDTMAHLKSTVDYYEGIGVGGRGQLGYRLPGGFNAFPVVWIVATTPPVVLVLVGFGLLGVWLRRREKEKTAVLWLLWLAVPIARVTWPGASIYGGGRQIMEFLPAMSLLAGLGAVVVLGWWGRLWREGRASRLGAVLVMVAFLPHLMFMVRLHPNENVYFNFLVGSLKGAWRLNIPYWGNSFGNAYLQAAHWLNANAAEGSNVALVQGTMTNLPAIYLKKGINYGNNYWSSVDRGGEYLLELTHEGSEVAYPGVWDYVERVLEPVYEVKADGVAIAKVWKNDAEHSASEYKKIERAEVKQVREQEENLLIELRNETTLARLVIIFKEDFSCSTFVGGEMEISDDAVAWARLPEKVEGNQVSTYPVLTKGMVRYLFPAYKARYIRILANDGKSCLFNRVKVQVEGFVGK